MTDFVNTSGNDSTQPTVFLSPQKNDSNQPTVNFSFQANNITGKRGREEAPDPFDKKQRSTFLVPDFENILGKGANKEVDIQQGYQLLQTNGLSWI